MMLTHNESRTNYWPVHQLIVPQHPPLDATLLRVTPRCLQNHLSQVHETLLGLLSAAGRTHVSGIVRQRGILYGPGALPLKDSVKNYTGFTGAHKALLGSIQLLVFRGVLANVSTMVRMQKVAVCIEKEELVRQDAAIPNITLFSTPVLTESESR